MKTSARRLKQRRLSVRKHVLRLKKRLVRQLRKPPTHLLKKRKLHDSVFDWFTQTIRNFLDVP